MLGCNLPQAYLSQKVIFGEPRSPCGLHTGLRWTIYGRDGGNQKLPRSPQLMVNSMTTAEHNAESCKQLLDVFEQDFRDCDENVGIKKLSIEDKQAIRILGRSSKKVLVDEEDRDALQCLWFKDDDLKLPAETFQMETHVFGAKLSPCCAAYVLR